MSTRNPADWDPWLQRSPSQTTPLLLEMVRRQAERRRPADVLRQWQRDGFVEPSDHDARFVHRLDGLALEAAAEYEARLLSPVAPLGTCSTVAPTGQDRVLSTVRGTEVVSDPTNVLALESALRLTTESKATVRLCTVHQVLRAQSVGAAAGRSRHFRLLCMSEAGRGRADDGFEVEAVARQVDVFDRLFDACESLGARFADRGATVFVAEGSEVLGHRLSTALRAALPHVKVGTEPLESRYYDGVRVLFGARARDGEFVPIADIGVFDWMAQLCSNERLRFVASGMGLSLVPRLFMDRREQA